MFGTTGSCCAAAPRSPQEGSMSIHVIWQNIFGSSSQEHYCPEVQAFLEEQQSLTKTKSKRRTISRKSAASALNPEHEN